MLLLKNQKNTMQYKVELSRIAIKSLAKVDGRYKLRINVALVALGADPYIGKRLQGERQQEWSYRVSDYRIIYKIKVRELIVLIIDVGHRQGVY